MKLEMNGISKAFGQNAVLKNVRFHLNEGEICALLGENGAGKSTLMNILGGVIPADQGEILLGGVKQHFATPAQSLNAGIAFIHQELNLINDLTVYENMFIGRELQKKSGLLDHKAMIRETQKVFDQIGMDVNPRAMVRDLDASYKQIVEISRALMMNAKFIIMDEPTTSLTDPEIQRVFGMLRTLKKQQVGIVFISHKLREVMEICDRYTVLRDGVMVAQGAVQDVTTDDLARHMVGHDVVSGYREVQEISGREVLKLENLSHAPYFENVSLCVHAGEVLGITGLLGDGRSELFASVFGSLEGYTGDICLEGRQVRIKNTLQAMKLGIGYVPRNRKENGIIKDMDILDNGSIVTWDVLTGKNGLLDHKKQRADFNAQKEALRIKLDDVRNGITSLSGGNQQKVVLAKWLTRNPRLLILDNPTQGVDVGAKEEIYEIILRLAKEGVAVVVLSSEAQEVIRVCDRALVMYHGKVVDEVRGDRMNEHEIMRLATGG
ncbi:MAG: sugar ABC transporter ATP-binding protein [Clostridiales bacterium]|nr:sugar ABC transporter ATP-binding protein [Clostridiales bacterium]